MMRSMYSGVSGLRVHQTKMDVISNNIANINTVGFKRSSTSFKDSFNQTLTSATAANADRGGLNPQQVGLGANVGSIVTIMGQGAAQRTDYGSDLMIDGDGFFIVKDPDGFSFTRAGVFEIDAKGNLVDANGYKVCGWKAVEDPDNPGQQKVVQDTVTPINIYEGDNLYVGAQPTKNIEFTGNFDPSVSPQKNTISFYDTQGNKYTMNFNFEKDKNNPNIWNVSIPTTAAGPGGAGGNLEITINNEKKVYFNGTLTISPASIEFDQNGKIKDPTQSIINISGIDLTTLVDENGQPCNMGTTTGTTNGGNTGAINIDMTTVTQFKSKATVTSQMKDGNQAGSMTGYSIDGNGIIRGTYSNGQSKILAQIPLANFKNPAGLEKVGSNLFKETGTSSEFDGIGSEVSSLGSRIQSGALEMSNVDLSYEFSEMITTQRGFQANSRIITTSDEMIQELVSLKR